MFVTNAALGPLLFFLFVEDGMRSLPDTVVAEGCTQNDFAVPAVADDSAC